MAVNVWEPLSSHDLRRYCEPIAAPNLPDRRGYLIMLPIAMRAGVPRKRFACRDGTIFDVKMFATDDWHERLQ
jgi:hypothetical protein